MHGGKWANETRDLNLNLICFKLLPCFACFNKKLSLDFELYFTSGCKKNRTQQVEPFELKISDRFVNALWKANDYQDASLKK